MKQKRENNNSRNISRGKHVDKRENMDKMKIMDKKENMEEIMDSSLEKMEEILIKAAKDMPEPERELIVSKFMTERKRKWNSQLVFRRVAMITLCIFLFGSGTAFASSYTFRQAVIHFFTSGTNEEIPLEKFSDSKQKEDKKSNADNAQTDKKEEQITEDTDTPITIGDVTYLQKQKLDEHFQVTYLSCPSYCDIARTSSGNLLFYTQEEKSEKRSYYQYIDGELRQAEAEKFKAEGSIQLQNLSGVMSHSGDVSYNEICLPEMTFTVEWQQIGGDIVLDVSNVERFDIGTTFGGTKNGKSLKGECDGAFSVSTFPDDKKWVQVQFLYDTQCTDYQYPFLFQLDTKEIKDPLANVDLSAYACITQLSICDNKKEAVAYAGDNHSSLKRIWIDLESGDIREDITEAPVSDCDTFFSTSDTTVFYTTGKEEKMNGYLYNTETKTTTKLFSNVAWGYIWDYGFADTYVNLIGGNFATLYKEPENEVYLLDLTDGSRYLLEGIPASHDVSFFWNEEYSILSIAKNTELGASQLAFYIPKLKKAWYFERTLSENVEEESACWYGETGYLIQAVSQNREQYYLYLYEYTE